MRKVRCAENVPPLSWKALITDRLELAKRSPLSKKLAHCIVTTQDLALAAMTLSQLSYWHLPPHCNGIYNIIATVLHILEQK